MKGKKLGILVTAMTTLALTSSLALARPGGDAGDGRGQGNCPGYGQMAKLSPEKQAAFQKLHEAFAAKTVQMRADIGVKRAELNAIVVSPNPDQAKVAELSKAIGELQGKLIAERTQFQIQVAKEIGPSALGMGMGHGGHGYHHRGGAGF